MQFLGRHPTKAEIHPGTFKLVKSGPALHLHLLDPSCFPLHHVREQHLGAQHLEAVAIPLLVRLPDLGIERLGEGVGDRMLEVGKDLFPPRPPGGGDCPERLGKLRRDSFLPAQVLRRRLVRGFAVPDPELPLLQLVGDLQLGKVVQPARNRQPLFIG